MGPGGSPNETTGGEHPELFAQVEAMMGEVQDEGGRLQTGDDAEDAVVARIRSMGRVALEAWMRRRRAEFNATAPAKPWDGLGRSPDFPRKSVGRAGRSRHRPSSRLIEQLTIIPGDSNNGYERG